MITTTTTENETADATLVVTQTQPVIPDNNTEKNHQTTIISQNNVSETQNDNTENNN
jgi:hypothetical protein